IAERMPRRMGGAVLVFLLLIDVYDLLPERAQIQNAMASHPVEYKKEQKDFVAALPPGVRRLKSVPLYYLNWDNIHQVFGYALAAAERDMSINVAYLGRFDTRTVKARQDADLREAMEGPLDPSAVYVTRNSAIVSAIKSRPESRAAVKRVGRD